MLLRRTVAAATCPVGLAEAKAHVRVTHDAEDAVILGLVAQACDLVGEMAGRVLQAETWTLADAGFSGRVRLPKSPVSALVSVQYRDDAGVLQAQSIGDFLLYQDDDWSWVEPAAGKSWPAVQTRADGTVITFTAGYTVLPAGLRGAVLLTVGHLFEHRESVAPGAMATLPLGVDALVGVHRLGWVGA